MTAGFLQEYNESNELTEKSLKYIKIKEKTVRDTIHFVGDVQEANRRLF
jgi:hypothetical protein